MAVYLCRGCGTEFATQDKYNAHDCGAHTPVGVRDPLLVEREKTHGEFRLNASIHQKLLSVLKDFDLQHFNPPQRTAMEMICLKIARIMSNPKNVDSWADVAGYAKLGAEACDNG